MKSLKRPVPELRFPDFMEHWATVKLGEIAEFRRGSFPQPYGLAKWYGNDGAPFVQVYDVADNFRLKPDTKKHITYAAQKMSVFIPEGSLIVTIQGSIGRIAVTQYDAFLDRTLLFIKNTKVKLGMALLSYLLYLKFEDEKRKAPGGTIKTITKEALSLFKITFPTNETEQQKIADFLTSVDEKISALENKLELMQKYKKGIMQQIFSQKIRFKDENGKDFPEWKKTTYKNLIKSLGKTTRQSSQGNAAGKYPFFDNSTKAQSRYNDEYDFDSEVIIANTGGSAYFDYFYGKFAAMADCFVFTTTCNTKYLYFRLKHIENKIDHAGFTGSGIRHLDKQYLYDLQDIHPTSEGEQQKIADFLSCLDEKIATQQEKLKRAKLFKKALLQRMFV